MRDRRLCKFVVALAILFTLSAVAEGDTDLQLKWNVEISLPENWDYVARTADGAVRASSDSVTTSVREQMMRDDRKFVLLNAWRMESYVTDKVYLAIRYFPGKDWSADVIHAQNDAEALGRILDQEASYADKGFLRRLSLRTALLDGQNPFYVYQYLAKPTAPALDASPLVRTVVVIKTACGLYELRAVFPERFAELKPLIDSVQASLKIDVPLSSRCLPGN